MSQHFSGGEGIRELHGEKAHADEISRQISVSAASGRVGSENSLSQLTSLPVSPPSQVKLNQPTVLAQLAASLQLSIASARSPRLRREPAG